MKWDVTKLTPSQKRIADFIEKSGEHILYFSETELAQELQVSNATISRFWKTIGYENFKSFKDAIKEKEQLSPKSKLKNSLLQIEHQQLQIHEHLLTMTKNQLVNTYRNWIMNNLNKPSRSCLIVEKYISMHLLQQKVLLH